MNRLRRLLPFLSWFPLSRHALRADVQAGIAVALVLVPQSMAYAQLAGMPAYYGLYAAFLPAIVGALWGSSRQLATGPVAMVSLLTGAALSQFAAPGSEHFIALAIALALIVGVMELAMGTLRLGAVVSFLSHPVVVGFTNAAALIIALSQISRLLGVASGREENFLAEVWGVLQQAGDTHVPTLLMALAALSIMIVLRRYAPAWPSVLIAVALTTVVSWQFGFERKGEAPVDSVADSEIRLLAREHAAATAHIARLSGELAGKSADVKALEHARERNSQRILALRYEIEVLRLAMRDAERENRVRARALRKFVFERAGGPGDTRLYSAGSVPAGVATDAHRWRINRIVDGTLELSGGGEVVGAIPAGLPALRLPAITWDMLVTLLTTAFVITLVGFMEAVSIAKAMATRTRQRINPNQELIGQGLANVVGSCFQSFPVSGSFSRSAVNLSSGAVTGLSSVVAGLVVLVTLLALTPLLYHLPQSVLAAIIVMAVVNLVNLEAIRHIWKAQRHDGIAAVATFAATLFFAPHLDTGILVGATFAIVLYLYRTMRPRVVVLGRHADGTLRDAALHGLPTSRHVVAIRFDGSLYFANVPYFEDAVLEQVARHPDARYVLVVGDGVNELDASGEEVVRHLVQRLRENGVTLVFSGLKHQVLQVMERTGLLELIGPQNLYRTEDLALEAIRAATAAGTLPPEDFLLKPLR